LETGYACALLNMYMWKKTFCLETGYPCGGADDHGAPSANGYEVGIRKGCRTDELNMVCVCAPVTYPARRLVGREVLGVEPGVLVQRPGGDRGRRRG